MSELAAVITAISLWCANPSFTQEHENRCREALLDCLRIEMRGGSNFRASNKDIQCFRDFGVKTEERGKAK